MVRYTKKSKPMARKLTTRVNRLEKKVKETRPEMKFLHIVYNHSIDTDPTNSSQIHNIAGNITQGNGDSANRIGDKIHMKTLSLKGYFTLGDSTNVIRMCLVQFRRQVSTPTWESFVGASDGGTNQISSYFNHDKAGQYNVLFDKTYTLVTGHSDVVKFKEQINLTRAAKQIAYLAGGTVITTGAIYLFLISDSGAATHPTITSSVALRYIDP